MTGRHRRAATRRPPPGTFPPMGYAYIVLAAVLWGTLGIVGRVALGVGVEPL